MFDERYVPTLFVEIEGWIRDQLPAINCAIEKKELEPQVLVEAARPWAMRLLQEIRPELLSKDQARKAIQLIGFIVGSIERHFQSMHIPAGTAFAKLDGIEGLLVQLGRVAKHPPRDTHYTYWLWNNSQAPMTFTGDAQEVFFNHAVNHTHQVHTDTSNGLRPIALGEVSLDAAEVLPVLEDSANEVERLYQHFRGFMTKTQPDNVRAVEPHFFLTRMRTYLPTYPIQDMTWTGVNAANLAAQMQADYLIGIVIEDYANVVFNRLQYLTEEDQQALKADMSTKSVGSHLLDQLMLTPGEVVNADPLNLASYLTDFPSHKKSIMIAYKNLIAASARLTAMHWALIQNYIIKEIPKLSSKEKESLSVSPEKGTGGMTHKETEGIMRMRKMHPVMGILTSAIEIMEKNVIPV